MPYLKNRSVKTFHFSVMLDKKLYGYYMVYITYMYKVKSER